LCHTVKHFFYVPPVLVIWRRTASQTGAFTTAVDVLTLTDLVVMAEGLDVFRIRAVATGGRRFPPGNLSFGKGILIGWLSGG
jgi:hypothetical protein